MLTSCPTPLSYDPKPKSMNNFNYTFFEIIFYTALLDFIIISRNQIKRAIVKFQRLFITIINDRKTLSPTQTFLAG